MTTRAFQKIYTKIDNITKATVTLRATGVGNDELATVGGKLAQVVKIMGENVTLQIFAGTEGLSTDSEVVFHGEPPKLRVSDNLAWRFFNAYGEPLEGGEIIEGEAREPRQFRTLIDGDALWEQSRFAGGPIGRGGFGAGKDVDIDPGDGAGGAAQLNAPDSQPKGGRQRGDQFGDEFDSIGMTHAS